MAGAVIFKVLIEFRFAFDGFEGCVLGSFDGIEGFLQIDLRCFLSNLNVDWGIQICIVGHLVVFVLVEAIVYQILLREDVMDITAKVDQLANWNMRQQRVFLEEVLRSKKHLISRVDGGHIGQVLVELDIPEVIRQGSVLNSFQSGFDAILANGTDVFGK